MTLTSSDTDLQITRLFDALPEQVYAAWTNPLQLVRWWPVVSQSTEHVHWHARLGSAWQASLQAEGHLTGTVRGHFTAVDSNRRLAFTWIATHNDVESRVTVELAERRGATTEMRIIHAELPDAAARDQLCEFWDHACDMLDEVLQREGTTPPTGPMMAGSN